MVNISLLVVAAMVACMTTSAAPFFGLFDYDMCDDCSEESEGLTEYMCDLMCETVECSDEATTTSGSSSTGGTTGGASSTATEATTSSSNAAPDSATTAAAGGDATTTAAPATTAAPPAGL